MAEGHATLYYFTFPPIQRAGKNVSLTVGLRNDGTVPDFLWHRVYDTDTGTPVTGRGGWATAFNVGEERLIQLNITMPNKNWNLRIDVGHEE